MRSPTPPSSAPSGSTGSSPASATSAALPARPISFCATPRPAGYDINHNQLTGAAFIGTIGLDWQYAGIAPIHAAGASDLILRNVNSGAFEVYDIANNQLTGAASLGQVGLDWQLGGFAADPPSSSGAATGSSYTSTSQLVQAMAGFGGGSGAAADGLNAGLGSAETSQQLVLTTPHA